MVNQLKRMVLSPDTPSLCKPQLQTALAHISSETIKDVPIDTRVGQASQKVARLKKEYANVVNAQYNAERLVRDTKEKAIRIADQVDQAEKELNELCSMRAAAEDSKDRTPRIDLAQLLEPDAASRIIIDDIGIIGDESDLDLTDEERMAYQAQKKLFAAELTAAVQSHWGTLRQVVLRLVQGWVTRQTSLNWATPWRGHLSLSNKCFKRRNSWRSPSRMKLDAGGTPKTIPNTRRSVFVGNPSTWGPAARRHLQQSPCDVVGYVETHMNPAASEDILRDFDKAGRKAVLSPARPKSGGTSGGVAWGALKRYQTSSYRQLARHESQCLGADRALDTFPPGGHLDFSILSHCVCT